MIVSQFEYRNQDQEEVIKMARSDGTGPAGQRSMSSIKHKFLVMSSQKGVGKTSVIVNLAVALSKRGVKVGLMDDNFHGPGVFRMLGLESGVKSVSDKPCIPVAYSDDLKVA